MFRMPFQLAGLAMLALCVPLSLAGLRAEDAAPANAAKENKGQAKSRVEFDFLKVEPYDGQRTSLAGRWLLTVVSGGEGIPLILVEFTGAAEGPLQAQLLGGSEDFAGATVKTIRQTAEGRVELEVDNAGFPMHFQGHQKAAVIQGNVTAPTGVVMPARMYAARSSSFAAYRMREEPHVADAIAAFEADAASQIGKLQEVVAKYPASPIALDACEEILEQAEDHKLEPAVVEKTVDTYLKLAEAWGPRLVQDVRINVATIIGRLPQFAPIALKQIAAADERAADIVHERGRTRLTLAKGRALLATDDDESRRQGAEILYSLHDKFALDMLITNELLEYEQTYGSLDKAIELAAKLVAYPPTSEEFQKWRKAADRGVDYHGQLVKQFNDLWTKKHGSPNGQQAYLDDAYLRIVDSVIPKAPKSPAGDGSNRVVLYEMFTGATCFPCIAADASLTKLERSFAPTDVIVMRYHQHIPGPEPLVNHDGERRFVYYQGTGTPLAIGNGLPFPDVGGLFEKARAAYATLQIPLESVLQTQPEVTVDLSAETTDGVVSFSAMADGLEKIARERRRERTGAMTYAGIAVLVLIALMLVLIGRHTIGALTSRVDTPWMHALLMKRIRWVLAVGCLVGAAVIAYRLLPTDDDVGDLRLRLALVEDEISFAAPNGIRVHDGIVRVMPGGPDGIKPAGGRLSFSGSIDLQALRRQLAAELSDYEASHHLKFREKPIDLKKLRLVAFVQNDSSLEVLQAAAVDVAGLPPAAGTPVGASSSTLPTPPVIGVTGSQPEPSQGQTGSQ